MQQTSINALHSQRVLREITSLGTLIIMLLVLSVVGSALGVVYVKQQTRVLFSELQGLQKQRDDLHIEQTQLMLEESAWSTYGRIDALAHDKLSMTLPSQNDIIMVHP